MKKLLVIALLTIPFFYSNAYAGEWVLCANEKGYCSFSGSKKVKYGAGNRWHYLTLNNGTACHNNTFGDPAHNRKKRCYYYKPASYRWSFCATEKRKCDFSGRKVVRYGANGKYKYKTLESGAYCNNYVFGDPARGITKSCYVKVWN